MNEQEIFNIVKEKLKENGMEVSDNEINNFVQEFLNEVKEQEIDEDFLERQLRSLVRLFCSIKFDSLEKA